ncbi:MAG: 30S ribosomal protein S20 [candidate division FCPU426 bacterium]
MPRIKSSIKDVRKNRAQRTINRQRLASLKTVLRRIRATGQDQRPAAIREAYHAIDKAVQAGLIHKNAGARYKSRLTKAPAAAATAAK